MATDFDEIVGGDGVSGDGGAQLRLDLVGGEWHNDQRMSAVKMKRKMTDRRRRVNSKTE